MALCLVMYLTNVFLFISPCTLLPLIDLPRVHEEIGLEYGQYSLKPGLLLPCAPENTRTTWTSI